MIRLVAVIELEGQAPRALTHESANRAIVIGRDASSDFQIPLSTISRQHTRISESDKVYTIEDLGSTHGTVVNGKKIGRGEKKILNDGDVIELTKAKITCTIESEKLVSIDPSEGTKAIAAKAVQGILGRLGDANDDGPYLRVLNGADEGIRFPFVGTLSEWTLGRSKECEFVLNDPNVSRRHATIKRDWNGFVVHDLGSKNGVQVNERLIKKPRRLRDRDELTIGPVKLVYIDPNADLMASLKDVPGFELEEPSDPGPDEAEPDEVLMGGPPGEHGPDGEEGEGPSIEDAAEVDRADADPAAMEDDDYAGIDPDLLEEVKSSAPIELIITIVVGLVIVLAALLFFVLV